MKNNNRYFLILKLLSKFDYLRDNNSDVNYVLNEFSRYFYELIGLNISVVYNDVNGDYIFCGYSFDKDVINFVQNKHLIHKIDKQCLYIRKFEITASVYGYVILHFNNKLSKNNIFIIKKLIAFLDSYILAQLQKSIQHRKESIITKINEFISQITYSNSDIFLELINIVAKEFNAVGFYINEDIANHENLQYINYRFESEKIVTFVFKRLSVLNKRVLDDVIEYIKKEIEHNRYATIVVKRFTKYVNSKNINKLINNISLLNPRKESVTLMSVDIVDSTKFAANNSDSMDTFVQINSYLDFIAHIIIDQFDGTLDKFIGDEVMAIFGAPIGDKNSYKTAIACANKIKKSVVEFNKKREKHCLPVFGIKIVLGYVEDAIVGEVGSSKTQLDYTIIGDDVNRFFRIAKYGVRDNIVVNEKLAKKLEYNGVEIFKTVSVKGIEEEQNIYILKN